MSKNRPHPLVSPVRNCAQTVQSLLTWPEKWAYQSGILSAERLCLPDFLGIGAQKAGTTWLWHNLRCHPELFLPDQKELHFFDRRYHRSLRTYSRKFLPGKDKVKGEITPAYSSLSEDRVRLIHSVMPNARLILLLRDPIERAWSHALMHLLEKVSVRRYEDVPEHEWIAHLTGEDSRSKGNYPAIIARWTRYYSAEQLYIGFLDEIAAQPEMVLADIFRHVGVSTEVDWQRFPLRTTANKGQRHPLPPQYRELLLDLYQEDLQYLSQRFGKRVETWGQPRRSLADTEVLRSG